MKVSKIAWSLALVALTATASVVASEGPHSTAGTPALSGCCPAKASTAAVDVAKPVVGSPRGLATSPAATPAPAQSGCGSQSTRTQKVPGRMSCCS
jgi:hypothetical protein